MDMLSNPWAGGGIEHVIDCFKHYMKSPHVNPQQLVEYGERLGNAAVFKRLGFLTERLVGEDHLLLPACKSRLSEGNAQLDPALNGDKLITRWRLFVPSVSRCRNDVHRHRKSAPAEAVFGGHAEDRDMYFAARFAGSCSRDPRMIPS